MRVAIVRTMPNFSMDVYADGVISGLKKIRPNWEIVELVPHPIDRHSSSLFLRIKKYYERFWNFPRLVEYQKADIFHIIDHSEGHIVNWLKKADKPVVVTCHDLINCFYGDNLQGSVKIPFLSNGMWLKSVKAMRNANHVVTVSSVTAKDTNKILNIESEHISVVPNAVESIFQVLSKNQAESFRQKHQVSSETLCLVNVGSNHPRKNISTILKVVKILKEKNLPIKFWKAGADFTDDDKKFIETQSLENEVSYIGQPEKATLVEIYNAADILIAPSLHEGFGITLLEAMACGTPVITSNVSAMPEVVGDAGILVEPTNSQEIANAVEKLYQDAVYRQKLIAMGIERAKLFTWEATAEQIAKIYEKFAK
ncbi:MAG: glycosyltransferase family 4 protein [Rivularia sp. T60_A2020_040]|nr:glycosyltransferase family 4 protein [Rivularia sp. T60_A2020_040]